MKPLKIALISWSPKYLKLVIGDKLNPRSKTTKTKENTWAALAVAVYAANNK